MSHVPSSPVPRRGFLFRLSQAAAGLTALFAGTAQAEEASRSIALVAADDPDVWMNRLTGQHKVMIHVHQFIMTALTDARTMLANARDSYGVPADQYSLAVITHGAAVQGLFRDEVWQRLALGAYYKVNDSKTGAPATRNIYLNSQDGEPPDAAVLDLMKRGVTFVVCNVALRNLSKASRARGVDSRRGVCGTGRRARAWRVSHARRLRIDAARAEAWGGVRLHRPPLKTARASTAARRPCLPGRLSIDSEHGRHRPTPGRARRALRHRP